MKTAISLPDDLSQSIETFIKTTHMSRSEFFQKAARAYLEKASSKAITANLNRVYEKNPTSDDASFHQAAMRHFQDVIGKEEW